ncbi:MAG: transcriptional regulator [Rhizobiaceae bacterium]|nr:transcriptional regulator [Rhizobiaceae bacterium]
MATISYNTYDVGSSQHRTPWTMEIGQNVRMRQQPRERLQLARAKAGFKNPADASRAFRDINQNTLTSHENGNRTISRKAAEKYARHFGVEAGWILYGDRSDLEFPGLYRIPVLSWVSASNLREQPGVTAADIERWVQVADLPAGDWIALGVDGDSMNRVAPDGSTIIVNRADDRLLDGRYYVFQQGGGAATFKRYKRNPEMMQPFSTNPDHMSIAIADDLYVFGRVRRVITDL